jgi:hypothetical protein
MVVEEDEGLHPKISILPSKIPDPEAPPGSCMISPPHIKLGALALFRSSLDRTSLPQKTFSPFEKTAMRSAFHHRDGTWMNQLPPSTKSSTKSKFTFTNPHRHDAATYDMFSKVDSKFKRELDPVKIERMLSRHDHKTLYGLD